MDTIQLRAYAKINLALDVTGRRPNGYHDVRMIMQTIQLHDKVTITPIAKEEILLKTNLGFLPAGPGNLVYDAADLFFRHTGVRRGVHIDLEKHIPVAAGMAGGSTDAAATLTGLNELFDTGLSLSQLQALGVTLGADIPFCLQGGTALSEGIGEILTPLPTPPRCHVLIVKPSAGVSTKFVYQNLILNESTPHPDVDGMIQALHDGNYRGIVDRLGNVLATVTEQHCPEIPSIRREMLRLGADGALMSGSGPTVFGLFSDERKANDAYYHFKVSEYGNQTFLTTW